MNVSLQNIDKTSSKLTVSVLRSDIQENVEKSLKKIRKDAQMPGFRKGMVPASLVKKLYGQNVEIDELNKFLGETLNSYIQENDIHILGEPLPALEQEQIDVTAQDEFTFLFDLALRPEFCVELGKDDKLPYYDVTVSQSAVDDQVKAFQQRDGKRVNAESYQEKDMLKGQLQELTDNGQVKEGGINLTDAILMPSYFKNDEQKAIFQDARLSETVVFNPYKAYDASQGELSSLLKISKDEAAEAKADFSFTISEISRFEPAPLDQDLFDSAFGENVVTTEEEFRQHITENLQKQYALDSDFKFFMDARKYVLDKVGKLEFSEPLLRRIMKANNPDKDDQFIDENFNASVEQLTWQLIRDDMAVKFGIKVDDDDIMGAARQSVRSQLAQYGIMGLPDSQVDNYAKGMLKKQETVEELFGRVLNDKLTTALLAQVSLEHKEISLEDFNKLFEA